MMLYATAKELLQFAVPGLPGTERRIKERANKQNWPYRPREGRGGGVEYPILGTPEADQVLTPEQQAHVRAVLAERNAHETVGAEAVKALVDSKLAELERESQVQEAGLVAARSLDDTARDRMAARLEILRLWSIYWTNHVPPIPQTLSEWRFADAYNDYGIDAPEWVRDFFPDISASTLRRWRKVQKEEGIAALAGKYGNRKGTGLIDTQEDVKGFILGMIKNAPHVQARHVYELMLVSFKDRADLTLPSLRVVTRWMSDWKARDPESFMAITNPDAYKNKYMAAFGSASERIERLNQQWEMDSTPTDLILAGGSRHNIVGVVDVYTRRLKLYVTTTSRSTAVAALLRKALLDWGVPEVVKTDNGSDYVSHHIKEVLAGLDIRQEICPPFQPWRKPHIEAAFRTFSHSFLELLPGYTGHDVVQRKAIESRKSFAENLMKRDSKATVELDFLTAEELQVYCDQWCENYYQHRVHSKLGKTPFELSTAWTLPVRVVTNERALDVLVAESPSGGARTVTKKGLSVEGYTFIAPELGACVGQRVKLRYDPQDFGRLFVFSELDGSFICIAECPEITGASRQEVAARAREIQQARIKEAKKALRAEAQKVKPHEVLAQLLEEKAEAAGKLTRFPAPEVEHETSAISAAHEAVEELNRVPDLSSDDVDVAAHQATIHQFQKRETSQEDDDLFGWEEALRLEKALAAKGDLPSKEMARLEHLRKQPWYAGLVPTLEALGLVTEAI